MIKTLKSFFLSLLLITSIFVFSSHIAPVTADVTQEPPKSEDFEKFNPLHIFNTSEGGEEYYANPEELSTPAGIMNRVLVFAFPIAGLILFVMLLWGGFEMLSGAATKKSLDAGRQRITAAVVGFLLLFVSFWIVQIIEVVFGVSIL